MLLQLTDSTEEPIYLFLIAFFFFVHTFIFEDLQKITAEAQQGPINLKVM